MPQIKKSILTLFLLLLVYSWFFFFHQNPQTPSFKVLGANANIALFIEPPMGRQPILDTINNAQSEILVEVYLMSDKQIIKALEAAKQRGVNVMVMLEQHPFGGGNLNNTTKKELESSGVSFEWTNSNFALTHEKSIVIDKSFAFILNQNLTASSFTKNREYDVVDTNTGDVSEIRNIFISDFERKSFSPKTSNLIVSPVNSRAALTTLIKSAAQSIDIEMEVINDEQIVLTLCDEAKKIKLKLIVPTFSQIDSNSESVNKLSACGAVIKTLSSPYVHAKLILVDNLKAYVGSVNLSSQSMDENRELGIIITQPESLKNLVLTFAADFEKGKSLNQN